MVDMGVAIESGLPGSGSLLPLSYCGWRVWGGTGRATMSHGRQEGASGGSAIGGEESCSRRGVKLISGLCCLLGRTGGQGGAKPSPLRVHK